MIEILINRAVINPNAICFRRRQAASKRGAARRRARGHADAGQLPAPARHTKEKALPMQSDVAAPEARMLPHPVRLQRAQHGSLLPPQDSFGNGLGADSTGSAAFVCRQLSLTFLLPAGSGGNTHVALRRGQSSQTTASRPNCFPGSSEVLGRMRPLCSHLCPTPRAGSSPARPPAAGSNAGAPGGGEGEIQWERASG